MMDIPTLELGRFRQSGLHNVDLVHRRAYLPVATPPLGLTKSGLPVSVQVVAPYLEYRTAMYVARRLADLTGTGYVRPTEFVYRPR